MSTWVSLISVVVAVCGLGFAGWQLRMLVDDRREERNLEVQGVCASWYPKVNPTRLEMDEHGGAYWHYVISVDNPGKFPINQVKVTVTFPIEFERYVGAAMVERGRELTLHQPVIAGGGTRPWNRYLRMPYDEAQGKLKNITASVEFVDIKGTLYTTHWPRAKSEISG